MAHYAITIKIHILLGYKWRYIRADKARQGMKGKRYTEEGQGKRGKIPLQCGAWVRKIPPKGEKPGENGGA